MSAKNNYDAVIDKVERDYISFKEEMMLLSSEKLYEKAYKIFCIKDFYEILSDEYSFTDEQMQIILHFKGNILEPIYMEWLDVDISHRANFRDSIDTTFEMLP